MHREICRTPSVRDYSSVKGKRRLEIFGFLLSAVLIMIGTFCYMISTRMYKELFWPSLCTRDSSQHMENLTDSLFVNGSIVASNGMIYPSGSYWTSEDGTTWGCPCMLKTCLQKCCEKEQIHIFSEYVYDDYTGKIAECASHNVSLNPQNRKVHSAGSSPLQEVSIMDDHFYVISLGCKGRGMYALEEEENSNAFLIDDGTLFMNFSRNRLWQHTEYCMESSNESSTPHFMICVSEEVAVTMKEDDWKFLLKAAGMLVSVPCFIITLLVYTLLPQLRNLHGKALMCHVASLAVAYSSLAFVHFESRILPKALCVGLGFVIQFSLLASFFWLNVMCFDIWWVFSGLMPLRGSMREVEQFKFLLYSLYAWIFPFIVLAVSLVLEFAPGIPYAVIRPEMGINKCFFKEEDARLLYLYLPIGVLVYLNIGMFLTTSIRFKSHSRSVKKLQRGDSRRHCHAGRSTTDMQRFSLYLKLSLVMGANWVLELLSFFMDGATFWLITDLANALQGVIILYMFVGKRRILRMLNQKLFPKLEIISPESSIKTLSSARSTSSTQFSSVRCKVRKGSVDQCNIEDTLSCTSGD